MYIYIYISYIVKTPEIYQFTGIVITSLKVMLLIQKKFTMLLVDKKIAIHKTDDLAHLFYVYNCHIYIVTITCKICALGI